MSENTQTSILRDQRVFIIDDDPDLRLSVDKTLRRRGFEVEHFSDAISFLKSPFLGAPGCIVLDYHMPGMTGLELQSRLNEADIFTPIIFVTGHGGVPESVMATKAGAVDFLQKPYQPGVLASRVEIAFDLDRQERERRQELTARSGSLGALTLREREVFASIVGFPEMSSSKGIANQLGISPRTVEKHRAQVLKKLGCSSVADLLGRYADAALQQNEPQFLSPGPIDPFSRR